MDVSEYQVAAASFTSFGKDSPFDRRISMCGLGLAGEAAELTECFEAALFADDVYDRTKVNKEAGDVCWYLAETCTASGLELTRLVAIAADFRHGPTITATRLRAGLGGADLAKHIVQFFIAAGKTADYCKKLAHHKQPLDVPTLLVLLTPVVVALLDILAFCQMDLGTVMEANIVKLTARYPSGWSPAAALARADETPRS